MKFKFLISLVFLFFLTVSCDSGLKWNNPLDPESDTYQQCKTIEAGKSRCFNAYSIQICENGFWQYPQNCQEYEYCDEEKGECKPKNVCAENPCAKILHSNGECRQAKDGFECGCEGNYSWKEGQCIKSTGEICSICGDIEYATGYCPTDWEGNFFCECASNYGWDSQNRECIGDVVTTNCTGLPEYALWNTTDTITQTWNGEAWVPSRKGEYNETPSETECRFICDDTHHWENNLCRSDTQKNIRCEGLPKHASWNTASKITQTWNGSGWEPSTTGQFSEDACTDRCCFKCNENFNWNSPTSTCEPATRLAECTDLPENASWNSVSKITQTWNPAGWWEPASIAEYSEDNYSTDRCYFQCNTNYNWNFSELACNPAKRGADCSPKPENSIWNDYYNGTFTQTWNGSEWEPESYTSTHSATTATCHFVCDTNYEWNGSQCIFCDTSSGSYSWNGSQCLFALECSPDRTSFCVDSESGLFWSSSTKGLSLEDMTWQDAVDYCENLTEGGYTDWKLPTIDELRTLIQNCETSKTGGACPVADPGCLELSCWSEELCSCTNDVNYSKLADDGTFWSSSPRSDTAESAWAVLFDNADVDTVKKTDKNSVRCVRQYEE
ncbi:DUF1566 domain-containing protein [bacterium]|nr:DUF1566 domain-containing protein [bacterium]